MSVHIISHMDCLIISKNMPINTADKCQRFCQNKFVRQAGKRVSAHTHMSAYVSGKGASASQDMSQHTHTIECVNPSLFHVLYATSK